MDATACPLMIGRRFCSLQGDERGKTGVRKGVPVEHMEVSGGRGLRVQLWLFPGCFRLLCCACEDK